ncbi:MAG: uroporphyrinogen decarboxylase family protein [Chloroflexota bacterium]|nr:uroporphyrinogen decarboxylase family protein [Chloroflexota bacterium]
MANPTMSMIHGMLYGKGLHVGKLDNLGRVIATLTGKHADRIPFMGPQIHDHAMHITKVPARKYYWDAELLVDVHLAVNRWYRFDSDSIIADAYNFEVEALGAQFIYSDTAMPTVDTNHPLIKNKSDLDKLGPLDVTKARIPMASELAGIVTEKISGPFGQGFFCSPFSMICQAMGYPKAVRAIMRDKVFAQELFDYVENDVIFPFMKSQKAYGAKASAGADAWACFPNLPPDLVEEWVVPSAKRLADRCKKELKMTVAAGLAAADYCEEDPEKFDKEMMFSCWETASKTMFIDVAFSGMGRTQDWNMEWLQEFALSHGKGNKKLPIFGSLNGRFMRDSSPDVIVDKIREWINIMGRGGGLLFFIGNVPSDTPSVNIHTAVESVHKIGYYPIAGDLQSIIIDTPDFLPFDEWLKGQPEEEIILKAREWKPEEKKVFA